MMLPPGSIGLLKGETVGDSLKFASGEPPSTPK